MYCTINFKVNKKFKPLKTTDVAHYYDIREGILIIFSRYVMLPRK